MLDSEALISVCLSVWPFRRTLADIIMEKITEKQTEVGTVMSEVSGCPMPQLDPRVTEVYRGVGKVRTQRRVPGVYIYSSVSVMTGPAFSPEYPIFFLLQISERISTNT